jgi:hypothetical protein
MNKSMTASCHELKLPVENFAAKIVFQIVSVLLDRWVLHVYAKEK